MLEDEPVFQGIVCPQCKGRSDPPAGPLAEELRCPHCRAILRFKVSADSFAANARLEPTLAHFSTKPSAVAPSAPTESAGEFAVRPASPPPPPTWFLPPPLPVVEGTDEPDQAPVEKSRRSLGATFTSGIFTFAWRRNAMSQWLILSVGSIITAYLTLWIFWSLGTLSLFGALMAGFFTIADVYLGFLLTAPYAAACMVEIAEQTSYDVDDAEEWPVADYRERLFFLVRVGVLIVLGLMVGAGVGGTCSLVVPDSFPLALGPTVFVLFPILFLSTQETNSAWWPVSVPIWKSLPLAGPGWAGFYAVSAVLWAGWVVVAIRLYAWSPTTSPLFAAPLWAAAVFSYGRLLGRLAGCVMERIGRKQDEADEDEIGRPQMLEAR